MNREQFLKAMIRYTKIQPRGAPDFTDNFVVEFWFEAISGYGGDALGVALKKLCCQKWFPSIDDIKAECGDEPVSDDAIARDTAERIYAAITRFGSSGVHRFDKVVENIGEVGSKVVGGPSGWQCICDQVTYANASTFKAQWRESAKGHLEMHRKGVKGPAELPPVNENVAKLIEGASKNLLPVR